MTSLVPVPLSKVSTLLCGFWRPCQRVLPLRGLAPSLSRETVLRFRLAPGISRDRRHRTLLPKRNPRPNPKANLSHGPGAASGRRPDRMRWQRRSPGPEHGSGCGPDGALGGNLISPWQELCLMQWGGVLGWVSEWGWGGVECGVEWSGVWGGTCLLGWWWGWVYWGWCGSGGVVGWSDVWGGIFLLGW